MRLDRLFEEGKFVVTVEVEPPKGTQVSEMLERAESLRGLVDAINVTDQQSSVMRLGSLASCHLLKERGIEPVFQLTCRDRNRIALQSDLLSAWALGIENVLCLTGDHVSLGDHPQAKPVFDLDSVSLLWTARRLKEGYDLAGNPLQGSPDFCLGAVVTPEADPLEPQILKMERKLRAGAQFFQTQAVYDPKAYERFAREIEGLKAPILVGIIPLKSAKMARFMNENIAGIRVPDGVIAEMEQAKTKEERRRKSAEICARIVQAVRPHCQGIHLMPMGWEDLVPEILELAGIIP